jgi:hypothetical protein
MRRLTSQMERLAQEKPVALAIIERWVDLLCEEQDSQSAG